MTGLDEQLPLIEQLNGLRQRAVRLREEALTVLNTRPYAPRRRDGTGSAPTPAVGWQDPGDDVEKGLMLRALRFATGVEGRKTRKALIDDLKSMTFADSAKSVDPITTKDSYEHVPILRCALVLQALAETPGQALSSASMSCYYRVVQELYRGASPAWALGSARAGTETSASAFVTGECARALLSLERALRDTAKVVELLGAAATEPGTAAEPVKVWSAQNEKIRRYSLAVSIGTLEPNLLMELSKAPTPQQRLLDIVTSLGTYPDIDVTRGGTKTVRASSSDTTTSILEASSEASATIAHRALLRLKQTIETVSRMSQKEIENNPAAASDRIAKELKTAAQQVWLLLQPVVQYVTSIVDQELAAAADPRGRDLDAAELVFAAALLGRLSHRTPESPWNHPRLKIVVELISKLLRSDGRVTSARPFDALTKGYRLHVAGLEVTRRLAEILTHVDVAISAEFVQNMMQLLEDTRATSRDDSLAGWMADPPRPDRTSEWWATALAVDALNWTVQMLDSEINRRVLQHFSVRAPSDLQLGLENLFYPDFGLAAQRGTESVGAKLQRLRAHVCGVPLDARKHYSLILYGPPGTGKTTLVEALAKSADAPLVEITPSDILIGGEDAIERRARLVFTALSLLTHAVILFDEFDPILQERVQRSSELRVPETVFEFLTPGMLPKLKRLHDAAERHRVAYILATNFVYRLDEAARREGRFDDKHGVYPPDIVSRLGRLLEQFHLLHKRYPGGSESERVVEVVRRTAGGPIGPLSKRGWYTAPKQGAATDGAPFGYLSNGDAPAYVGKEATYDPNWKKKKNRSALESQYWSDWETVENWDKRAGARKGTHLRDWNQLIADWTGLGS